MVLHPRGARGGHAVAFEQRHRVPAVGTVQLFDPEVIHRVGLAPAVRTGGLVILENFGRHRLLQLLEGRVQRVEVDGLDFLFDHEPGHRVDVAADHVGAQAQRLHDAGATAHHGVQHHLALAHLRIGQVKVPDALLLALLEAEQIAAAGLGLGSLQRLLVGQGIEGHGAEDAAQPPRPPLVHGVDWAVVALGVRLALGDAVDLADGKFALDGLAIWH